MAPSHLFSTIAISQRKYLEFTVRLIDVPGQGLVVALTLIRGVSVHAAAKFMEVIDERLWLVVEASFIAP
ncbi:hypothetical protein EIB96_18545 [Vibrio parahaemolyticus]|nr:hypothetical protein [Vibrio parahaemolyticus]RFD44622.1 hypothetical protein H328_018775 [Vibrio parahaemolyticus 3355]EGR0988014.1 hypothetical protein [Vibrio parahaemolyticus]EGR1372851.1 hypothetical protein [Vibrio parahaemolyticus]EGR1948667.1 hypothetical protein [Vibrio parahaemolyticus]